MRNTRFILAFAGIVFILILLYEYRHTGIEGFQSEEGGVIWTCTTFFDFPKKDRWAAFQSCMDSIRTIHSKEELNLISRWVVINEYAESPKTDWAKEMKNKYPFVEFIQKTKDQHGQAKGLNMILELIKPYKYWFHWEETWDTRSPFIMRAITTMEKNPDITQLQMTYDHGRPDWYDVSNERKQCTEDICRIQPHEQTPTFINKNPDTLDLSSISNSGWWPLYSLRPSINRVSFYTTKNIGSFPEDPKLWPYLFELHYSIRWLRAGSVKAIFKTSPVYRQDTHVSTY